MLKHVIDVCVSRRLAVIAFTLGIAIYGFTAYQDTPIEAFPDVTNYQVNVITKAPGLAPEEVEKQITLPLERALNGTPGMISMRSESLFGLSLIYQTFDDDVDAFKARALVTERVAAAASDLPPGASAELAPEYTPLGEIYQYRLASDRHSLHELRSEQEWVLSTQFRQVPGVADVVGFGGFLPEVHVEVDPARLLAYGLTLADVRTALARSNTNVGGGFLRHGDQEMVVRGVGYLSSASDIQNIVLASKNGTPVTVGDVSRITLSNVPRRGDAGLDGTREIIEGFVLLRRGENPSVVLDGVHAKVDELNSKILPKGMVIEPFYDRSTLVEHTLGTVHHNLLFGALLILGVVWLFLRTIRGSLIVASVIPIALLAAFIGLHAIHLPANLISMGAIDFGILVDGAVILVENVIHMARERRPASRREMLGLVGHAAFDVSRPTFYAMAIIIAALIPVFTLQRVEGRIFRPLALTYTFALIGALVLALTLVPALCAAALGPRDATARDPRSIERLRAGYRRAVSGILGRRWIAYALAGGLVAFGALAGKRLGMEFLPELDEGDLVIFVEMPPSVALAKGQDVLLDIRKRLLAFPEVEATLSEHGHPEDGTDDEGTNMSETFVRLRPQRQWRSGLTKDALVEELRASLTEIPGVEYNFSQPIKDNVEEAVSGVRGKVVLKIFGNDLQKMRTSLEQAKTALAAVPGIVDLDLYRDSMVPQLQIVLDRAALARAGIAVDDAQDVVETALAGKVATSMWPAMWHDDRLVPVRVGLPAAERSDPERIGALMVTTADGGQVPLREIARIAVAQGRATINHEANSRFMALKFNVEGRDVGSVIQEAQALVGPGAKVRPPDGHYFVWGGEFENQQRAMARLRIVVPVALLVVLVLLYSALGSARSALAVILTAPFALTGGVFALLLAGIPLSVSAAVGFIALLGQVSLAGLLVVSAIESRCTAGMPLAEAIVEGPTSRFRALVMAAMLAILGLLPMALSHAVGSETQRPFAVVIIGGMVTTLVVALAVLPVLYHRIAPKRLGMRAITLAILVGTAAASPARAEPTEAAPPAEVTADQAVALYRAHSLQLIARRATVEVTAADLVDAQIYPNPTLSLSTTNIVQGQDTFGHSQETLGLDLPILIGRQRSHRADAATARIAARRAEVEVDQAAAELEIRRRFIALLAAQERAAALASAFEDARAVRAIVAGRQSAGAKSPYELERTDLALAAAASKRATAVTEAAAASGALARAVGIAGWQPRAAGPFVPDALAAPALAPSHPELAAGVAAQAAARSDQALAHAEAVPTPSLQLQTFGTTDPQGIALTVGVSVPLPVFDRNQGAVARARAQQRAADLAHAATASQLAADLARAVENERSRRAAVAQFESDAIARLPRVRAMAEASYRAGQGTIVELLDALDAITEARLRDLELVAAALDAALDVRAAALGR